MSKRTKDYEIGLYERLQNPAYATEYLQAALEDDEEGSDAVFLLALRDVAKANRMTYVADATGLNRESLYKMLSRRGNPGINSLKAVLSAVGLRLSVEVAERKPAPQHIASWSVACAVPERTVAPEGLLSGLPAPGALPHREVGRECLANPPPGPRWEQTSASGPCTQGFGALGTMIISQSQEEIRSAVTAIRWSQ